MMVQRIATAMVLLLSTLPIYAQTEQEAVDALLQRLGSASAEAQSDWTVSEIRLAASLRIASDRRELELQIAQKQLGAELAAAAAELTKAGEQNAAQARGAYMQATTTALGQFQQALGSLYSQWSQDTGAVYNRAMQEASGTLSTLQQALSSALQTFMTAIQDPDLREMPPVIEAKLPDFQGWQKLTPNEVQALEKAIADSRESYHKDVAAMLAASNGELEQAIGLETPAERTAAIRKAINKLKVTCLDRHDQYAGEVRAILRKALLGE